MGASVAYLIAAVLPRREWDGGRELSQLAGTVGLRVAGVTSQKRQRADSRTYIGKGRLSDLKNEISREEEPVVVIADDNLSPGQIRNLEKFLDTEVMDRSDLILTIFERNARTRQAKVQVELARLRYQMNRLEKMWTHLERQHGAGRLARGMGEKQIEVDRRLMSRRINRLEKQLTVIKRQAATSRRQRQGLYRVALVGYTNAGKSTLMKALTDRDVLSSNKMFATLDTKTSLMDKDWPPVLLSDTVGFIRKIPSDLLSAFRSTLAEVIEADCLLEVVDASDPEWPDHLESVRRVLNEIGAGDQYRLTVFNKADALTEEDFEELKQLVGPTPRLISARAGQGLEELRETLHASALHEACPVSLVIPASSGEWVSQALRRDIGKTASWKEGNLFVDLTLPETEIIKYEGVKEITVTRRKNLKLEHLA